jgi:Flp pilus assembly protein TadD
MTTSSIDRKPARKGLRLRPRAGSIVIGSCLAAVGVIETGCVATPRQAARPAGPSTPQVPEGASGAAPVVPDQPVSHRTDLQETATDRQKFQVHIDFGRVFEVQGNFDAAVLEYQDALTVLGGRRRGPFRPEDQALAHRRMGGALDRLGRFAQAEVHYKKALKFTPKDAKIWNDTGYSYYLQGRWDDSERALRMAHKLAPDDERIRTNLGLTLAAANKADEALALLSQSSGDAVAHANLGYLLAATGQFDLARRQYETALSLRPDLELAQRALAKLESQQAGALQASTASTPAKPPGPTLRTTSAPVDGGVKPASTSRLDIPPPVRSSIRSGGPSPRPGEVQPPLSDAPPDGDLSDLPPPPPL